jgi:peptidoglycan/LPS O-acetylase OafA/YrhL
MALDSIFFGGMLGGIGVFLFFSISGFLIAYTVFQKTANRQYGFRNYFVDRFSRIYSGLLPAILISIVVMGGIYATNSVYFNHLLYTEQPPSVQSFVATLGMLDMFPSGLFNATSTAIFGTSSSSAAIAPFSFNGVLWTLVVEWWLYMFFGWMILGFVEFHGKQSSTNLGKLLFFIVAALLSIILVALAWDYSAFIIVWFLGAAMMYLTCNPTVRSKLSSPLVTVVLVALFIFALATVGYVANVIFTLTHDSFSLLFGLLISACVFISLFIVNSRTFPSISSLILKKRVVKWSSSIAAFSYTLFLIHYPIILFLNGLNLEADRFLLFIPILLLINEVAFIVASLTEKKHRVLAAKIKRALKISPY